MKKESTLTHAEFIERLRELLRKDPVRPPRVIYDKHGRVEQ